MACLLTIARSTRLLRRFHHVDGPLRRKIARYFAWRKKRQSVTEITSW